MSKIPKHAKRVFKGVLFDVYQWPQKLFDGSTETFEALKRADTVVTVAVTPEGQLLVVDDEQPGRPKELSFCSGRVDPGEQPLAAAQRELLEETGYGSNQWESWYSFPQPGKVEASVHYFVARAVTKRAEQRLDPGEKIDVKFMPIEKVLDAISAGELKAYELGEHIMRQMLQGRRDDLVQFLAEKRKEHTAAKNE